jgi:hypothetical protein
MKTTILRATTILALVMGFAAVSAQAQTSFNREKFTVPFEFNVGSEVLPAGAYTVFVENQTIRLRKDDGKANVIALTQRIRLSHSDSEVKLTFRQFGDHVYLSQVWLADGIGRELKRKRIENTDVARNFITVEVFPTR